MKAFIAGLILIVLSGAALLWNRLAETAPPPAQTAERTVHCMVWKAQRGHATVWLCGSFHLLRESDYPLPEPYQKAFEEAKTVVMELPPGSMDDEAGKELFLAAGIVPAGKSLKDMISAKTWIALEAWASRNATSTDSLLPMKPWLAGMTVAMTTYERLGFSVSRGMERWFTARLGDKKRAGLETPESQLAIFDKFDAPLQDEMIRQAVEEEKEAAACVKDMTSAWLTGDTRRLDALMEANMRGFPDLKKLLSDDRNASWLPAIEKYLDGTETVMVLVGAAHLAGEGSVVDLLEKKGVTLTQMEYRTRRGAN